MKEEKVEKRNNIVREKKKGKRGGEWGARELERSRKAKEKKRKPEYQNSI